MVLLIEIQPFLFQGYILAFFFTIIFRKSMETSAIYKQHLQKLYNQNTVVEDSELTSFCYLKTLALEFLIVIFTLVSLVSVLYDYFGHSSAPEETDKWDLISFLFTILTIMTVIFQKLAVIEWIKQKKDYQRKPIHQIIFMVGEIIFLLPSPSIFINNQTTLTIYDINGIQIQIKIQELLAAYVTIRCAYFLKFLIHFQLYYGSRPDRLSRLYTVKFGTYNAFKFLINEKPMVILGVIFIVNYIYLPLVLLLVEGNVNPSLNNFIACVYYEVVSQVTVGYGDIIVITSIGRYLMIISIIIGITTTSILLIFFMRLMEQDSNEEQSHALMNILEQKQELAKAMVQRVETQVKCLSRKVPTEQKNEYEQKLNQFKFKNARRIRYQKEPAPNLKRMMMGNFAALLEGIHQLKETEIMLGKYIKIIENSNSLTQ